MMKATLLSAMIILLRFSIYDIIAYRSLRPLANVVRILRKQVFDLRELRKASLLARYMRWMNLHAFRCCSRALWQATTPHQCDSVWVRACMLTVFEESNDSPLISRATRI